MTTDLKTADELAADRTRLAAQRTLMAADRSLMAWIRTALSMISFGFTIYKVLEGFQQGGATFPNDSTPRNVGLFLTGLGTVSMVLGAIEYLGMRAELLPSMRIRLWRPVFAIAVIMSILGILLFSSIIARLL